MLRTEWRITVGSGSGERDITPAVLKIDSIRQGVDTRTLHRFKTGQARFDVSLAHAELLRVGNTDLLRAGEPVRITANNKVLFFGNITTLIRTLKKHVVAVVASDFSQHAHQDKITDFGIAKRVQVSPISTADDASGEYPFRIVAPISDKSLQNVRSGDKELELVERFTDRGQKLDEHLTYDENALRSEGNVLEPPPSATLKAPYRYKKIETLIKKLLAAYKWEGKVDTLASLAPLELGAAKTSDERFFSTNGRVGYDIENNLEPDTPNDVGTGTAVFWTGTVTDFLIDDDIFYFLYSGRSSRPRIIAYNPETDEYSDVYRGVDQDEVQEWWRMIKDGNHFYVLGTNRSSLIIDTPVLGAYDPTETLRRDARTFVKRIDVSGDSPSETVWVDAKETEYRPVVGMYYQLGFDVDGANNNVRQGIQPDTRKSFVLQKSKNETRLYYIFANRRQCGIAVAKRKRNTTETELEAFAAFPKDDYFNHLGIDFTIEQTSDSSDAAILFAGVTYQEKDKSQRLIFSKTIS